MPDTLPRVHAGPNRRAATATRGADSPTPLTAPPPADAPAAAPAGRNTTGSWTFLTNHAHVLVCLAQPGGMRLRDVAERVGITERAVQKMVADLEAAGVLTRSRDGRRNRYDIHLDQPLRHDVESHRSIGDLIRFILQSDGCPRS